jgi:hypothetical protein
VRHLTFTRKAGQTAAVLAISAVTLTFGATAAFADTSAATAQAASLTPLGLPVLNTGTQSASNTGGARVVSTPPGPLLLPGQSVITAGVFQQTAVANGDGTSSGCAGLVGNGSSIQVGLTNICDLTTTPGETGGITVGGPAGIGVISATAIVETCTASSTGTPVASASLVNASALAGAITIPANPAANTNLLGLGLVYLNTQSVSNGEITATALSIPLLGLKIGTVTCGPNAVTSVSSVFPVKSLPIAGGTAVVLGTAGVLWYRRRRRSVAS